MDTLTDLEARAVRSPSRDRGFVGLESSGAAPFWPLAAPGFSGIAESDALTLPTWYLAPTETSPTFQVEKAVTRTFAGVALGKSRRPEYNEHLELLPSPVATLRSLFPWSLTYRNGTEDAASSL